MSDERYNFDENVDLPPVDDKDPTRYELKIKASRGKKRIGISFEILHHVPVNTRWSGRKTRKLFAGTENFLSKNFESSKVYRTDTYKLFAEEYPDLMQREDYRQALNRVMAHVSKWLDEDYPIPEELRSDDPYDLDPTEAILFFSDEDGKWKIIEDEIDRNYVGQTAPKMYTFMKVLQAYTPEYAQIHLVATTSTGKTILIKVVVLDLFPPEHVKNIAEFSPTALRRTEGLDRLKIIVLSQSEGSGNKYHLLMTSRDDNTGAVCTITNMDTGKTEDFQLPHLSFISTSIDLFLSSEHSTRVDRVFLDESIKQNNDAGDFIADRWSVDNKLKEALGKLPPSNRDLIRDAIRLYSRDIYTVSVPFMPYVKEVMDFVKQRAKRDLHSIGGLISGVTNFNKFHREFLVIGDEIRLIATGKDLRLCMKYGEGNMTQTYFDVPLTYSKVVKIIKTLSEDSWYSNGWIYIKDIEKEAQKESIDRSTLKMKLKKLAEETHYIERNDSYEWDKGKRREDKEGKYIRKRGYSYKFIDMTPESIFKEVIDYDKVREDIEEWKNIMIAEGGEILTYEQIQERQKNAISTPSDPDHTDLTDHTWKISEQILCCRYQ